MTMNRLPYSRFLKLATIVAIVLGSTLGVGGQRHRGKVSSDLLSFESRRTNGAHARHRPRLADGDRSARVAAGPAHRAVARRLGGAAREQRASVGACRRARCALGRPARWAVHGRVDRVDRVRSGSHRATVDCLLGLGAIPGVTGAGVTVAVLDTGIAPHPALTGKVIFNVSKIAGDPSTNDAHGHGTHIAGIIAGNSSASKYVTTPLQRRHRS